MPQYNLSKWPKPHEEPDGLFKPYVDVDTFLWSPVVELNLQWSPTTLTGALRWYRSGVATAEMFGEFLRYTSEKTIHDSYAIFDLWWEDIGPPLYWRGRCSLFYYPPKQLQTTPAVFGQGDFADPSANGRERYIIASAYALPGTLPPCWEPLQDNVRIFARALDPLDYEVEERSWSVPSCNP